MVKNIGNVQVDIKDIKNNITNINSKVDANVTAINKVNVKVDGVKGDLDGLKGRVDRHDQRFRLLTR